MSDQNNHCTITHAAVFSAQSRIRRHSLRRHSQNNHSNRPCRGIPCMRRHSLHKHACDGITRMIIVQSSMRRNSLPKHACGGTLSTIPAHSPMRRHSLHKHDCCGAPRILTSLHNRPAATLPEYSLHNHARRQSENNRCTITQFSCRFPAKPYRAVL